MNTFKFGAFLLLISGLPGCILAPGMKQTIPPAIPGVEIIEITPDLILSQNIGVDVSEPRFESSGLEGALRSKLSSYEDWYEYRVGPRDILTITVI